MDLEFPDKLYYKIGEVAQLANVRTSVLRFWESEFSFLKPEKSSTGQRLYSKKEVKLILEIKNLLYIDKFTLEGVKKRISSRGKISSPEETPPTISSIHIDLLKEIKLELLAIRGQL